MHKEHPRPIQAPIPFSSVTTYIENGGPITITNDLKPTGKLVRDQNVKLDDELNRWLDDIATASDEKTAKVARIGIMFFKKFYPIHKKMLHYEDSIYALIKTLP